ncbi:MAG: hypothetical protein EAX96_05850 [Candidatus Lokiarchaeota archaeon]|nr:hypothetical protein [Candidatus Lokiarchaeota archaeon]
MSIDLEKIEGIGATTAEKLKEEGIMNAMMLASTTVKKLKSLGFSDSSARKWIDKARELTDTSMGGSFGFVMGDALLDNFNKRMVLKTGQPVLDAVLGGGFETQKVYELYGPEGSGKSSLLHQLICISKLPVSKGGLGSPATIFLDCEGALSVKRLQEMAPFWGLSPEEAVKSIAHTVPPTSDALVFLCEENLPKVMDQTQARLILLDSIATHFRSEYGDARQLFPERQQKANRILHALKRMAVNYNALVLITNQVTGNVDAANKYAKKYSHSMGYIIGHESQVRILIEKKGDFRKIYVEKAIDLPNNYCNVVMTQYGLLDPQVIKEKKIKAPTKAAEVLILPSKNKKKDNTKDNEDDESEEVVSEDQELIFSEDAEPEISEEQLEEEFDQELPEEVPNINKLPAESEEDSKKTNSKKKSKSKK